MVVGGLLQVSIILMIIITMQKNRAGHAKEAIAKGLLIDGRLRATVDLLIPLPFDDGQHKLGMLKFWEIRSKKSIMNIYNGGASKATRLHRIRLTFIGFIGQSITDQACPVHPQQPPFKRVPTLNSATQIHAIHPKNDCPRHQRRPSSLCGHPSVHLLPSTDLSSAAWMAQIGPRQPNRPQLGWSSDRPTDRHVMEFDQGDGIMWWPRRSWSSERKRLGIEKNNSTVNGIC